MNKEIKNIVVVGCGTIGSQLSVLLSAYGYQTSCFIRKDLSKYEKKIVQIQEHPYWKRLIRNNKEPNIRISSNRKNFRNADLVIEAINENEEDKLGIIQEIKENASPDTLVASTTSTLNIQKLSSSYYGDKFVGLHVFNPLFAIKLVEVIPTDKTSTESLNKIISLCHKINKKAVIAPDSPGFIVNRILTPFWIDCIRFLENSDLTAQELNDALKKGGNFSAGPFEVIDTIGIDMFCDGADSLYVQTMDKRFEVPKTLKKLLKENKLGVKTGEGILKY